MSKKQHKRKFIGQMKQTQEINLSSEQIAQHAKKAMDYLAPLVRAENMSPVQGMILVFGMMNFNITGEEKGMTLKEIHKGIIMILALWETGMFKPSPNYPHTLEQIFADFQEESEDEA